MIKLTASHSLSFHTVMFHFDKLQHEASIKFIDELIHDKINSIPFIEFSHRAREMHQRNVLMLFKALLN